MRSFPTPLNESFLFKLCELGDDLPHSSDAYADTKLLQARTLTKKGRAPEAATIYDALAKQPDLASGYQGALALWSGSNWEEQGDYVKALASYQPAEKEVDDQSKAQEAMTEGDPDVESERAFHNIPG